MTENQKLRESIKRLLKAHRITVQAPPKTITDAENQIAEIQNAVKFAEEALALPTAAPVGERELPPLHAGCLPTLNQDPYPALGDWWVQLWDGSGDDAKVIVRVYGNSPEQAKQRAEAMCQALDLPTAEVMTNGLTQAETDASASVSGLTAAPAGDLPELPEHYGLFNINGPDGHRIKGYTADQMRAYARAALSAGDAVDAQRLDFIEKSARCDPKMDGQHVWWPTSLNKTLKGPTLRDAIDASMRKGQL